MKPENIKKYVNRKVRLTYKFFGEGPSYTREGLLRNEDNFEDYHYYRLFIGRSRSRSICLDSEDISRIRYVEKEKK
jgi:hypothetical protein